MNTQERLEVYRRLIEYYEGEECLNEFNQVDGFCIAIKTIFDIDVSDHINFKYIFPELFAKNIHGYQACWFTVDFPEGRDLRLKAVTEAASETLEIVMNQLLEKI